MSNKDLLDSIKKLRELTGVGFKDCKVALEENNGEIEKSIEFLRKKGIAKASKKMSRTASEGLALVKEEKGEVAVIEINSETDFVAKNQDFINFCKELSSLNFKNKGNLEKLNNSKMDNGILVKDSLINLISKIGEKITIRRANFFSNSSGVNFFYVHSAIEKNIGYGRWTHGAAVACGMVIASELSEKLGKLSKNDLSRIKNLLSYFDLPIKLPKKINASKLYEAMKNDKKVLNNKIRLIIPKKIGECFISDKVSKSNILKTLEINRDQ